MYAPLALLVVATGLFAAGVVWRRGRTRPPGSLDLEQVQGFVFVGSGALVLLGVAVLVLGLVGRPGPAEATGVLGLAAYLVYLGVAVLIIVRSSRRTRRTRPWPPPEESSAPPV